VGHAADQRALGTTGQRRTWMAEVRCLVTMSVTPFMARLLAADFASPFANAATRDWATSTATPPCPVGDWIGLEVVKHALPKASP